MVLPQHRYISFLLHKATFFNFYRISPSCQTSQTDVVCCVPNNHQRALQSGVSCHVYAAEPKQERCETRKNQ